MLLKSELNSREPHAPDVETKLVLVTPELAAEYLESSSGNRRIRPGVVSAYARDMVAGSWLRTGDPIRFDWDGRMFDGHHRCLACVEASASFWSDVKTGLDPAVNVVLDTGARRTAANALTYLGEPNAAELANAISWAWRIERGVERDPNTRPSHSDIAEWLAQNPGVRGSLPWGKRVYGAVGGNRAVVSALHYLLCQLDGDPDDADAFFGTLASGEGLVAGSAILALRRNMEQRRADRAKPPAYYTVAVTTKAINLWRAGGYVKQLSWRAGGAGAEPFPVLKPREDFTG